MPDALNPLYDIDWSGCPERFTPGLQRYLAYGIKPGRALTAILRNDLGRFLTSADEDTYAEGPTLYRWLLHADGWPNRCWGSDDAVKLWTKEFGR